jgi:DNA mismatch repair ATPase MutS
MKRLSVDYTAKRGYCFALPTEDADSLPLEAVQAVKKKTRIVFTTEELQFLNNRVSESLATIFQITAELVEVGGCFALL